MYPADEDPLKVRWNYFEYDYEPVTSDVWLNNELKKVFDHELGGLHQGAALKKLEEYISWCEKPFWSPYEATAVSFGKNAVVLDKGYALCELPGHFVVLFRARMDFIKRAQASGELGQRIRLGEFVEWAKTVRLSYPQQLDVAIAAVREEMAALLARWHDADRRRVELERKIKELDQHLGQLSARPDGVTKLMTTAHLVIYAMARAKYRFDPEKNNYAARLIVDALFREGLRRDEDTVRELLKRASITADAEKAKEAQKAKLLLDKPKPNSVS
jgi:hypothetical protein